MQEVRLIGGPKDGEYESVSYSRHYIDFIYVEKFSVNRQDDFMRRPLIFRYSRCGPSSFIFDGTM